MNRVRFALLLFLALTGIAGRSLAGQHFDTGWRPMQLGVDIEVPLGIQPASDATVTLTAEMRYGYAVTAFEDDPLAYTHCMSLHFDSGSTAADWGSFTCGGGMLAGETHLNRITASCPMTFNHASIASTMRLRALGWMSEWNGEPVFGHSYWGTWSLVRGYVRVSGDVN